WAPLPWRERAEAAVSATWPSHMATNALIRSPWQSRSSSSSSWCRDCSHSETSCHVLSEEDKKEKIYHEKINFTNIHSCIVSCSCRLRRRQRGDGQSRNQRNRHFDMGLRC